MPDEITWLSTPQAGARLGVHRTRIFQMIRDGELPAVRAGVRYWRVREDDLDALEAKREHQHHVRSGAATPGCEHCAPSPAASAPCSAAGEGLDAAGEGR